MDSFSSAHLAFDVLQVWSSLLKEAQAVNIGGPGVLRTLAPLDFILSTPASAYLQDRQTAREGSGVVISLGTEILKVPQHGILSALPCMALSLVQRQPAGGAVRPSLQTVLWFSHPVTRFWVMWINQEPSPLLISDGVSFVTRWASLLPLIPLFHWQPQEEDSFYHTHHGDLCLTPPLEPGKEEVLGKLPFRAL